MDKYIKLQGVKSTRSYKFDIKLTCYKKSLDIYIVIFDVIRNIRSLQIELRLFHTDTNNNRREEFSLPNSLGISALFHMLIGGQRYP